MTLCGRGRAPSPGHQRSVIVGLALGLMLAASAGAQDWDEAYRGGLAALARGDHARAADAMRRAIALHPEPGRNVLTYGTNIEPRYFPYLRLAEALLGLGRLDEAGDVLARSSAWGTREPDDERRALATRLAAAVAASRPAPPPPVVAAPTAAPTAPAPHHTDPDAHRRADVAAPGRGSAPGCGAASSATCSRGDCASTVRSARFPTPARPFTPWWSARQQSDRSRCSRTRREPRSTSTTSWSARPTPLRAGW